jgi:hypothetical protein
LEAIVKFHIGDTVREGCRVGTVTDVGTVLVQMTSSGGASRMVCPWELVKIHDSPELLGSDPSLP